MAGPAKILLPVSGNGWKVKSSEDAIRPAQGYLITINWSAAVVCVTSEGQRLSMHVGAQSQFSEIHYYPAGMMVVFRRS